jgi:anti-sigma B factor antagonist
MSPDAFGIAIRDVPGAHVISLTGEFDLAVAHQFVERAEGLTGATVVVDLSALVFMDSSGIAALVRARNHQAELGNPLVLVGPVGIVERALDVVGLSDWITEWSPEWSEGTDQPT